MLRVVEDVEFRDGLGKLLRVKSFKGTMLGLERRSKAIFYPAHLRRTGATALIVGTWLTAFNQGDAFWTGELYSWLWIKVALNYLTPFVVANLGLLSKESEKSKGRNHPTEH